MYSRNLNNKKQSAKRLILIFVGLCLVAVVLLLVFLRQEAESPGSNDNLNSTDVVAEERKIDGVLRITATGDMIAHDSINLNAESASGYDYLQLMDQTKPYFDKGDVNFCNQAVLGAGEDFGIRGYPVFNSPTEFARDMNRLGCNLINTGTNHTNDLNQASIDASVSVWDDLDVLATAGANRSQQEHDSVRYFEVEGVKFAFVSYTTYTNAKGDNEYGLTLYNQELSKRQLEEAEEKADITIVSMRWGVEYSQRESDTQRGIAKLLTGHGADLIFGHGTHVLAPVEFVRSGGNESIVWYSLGNYLNSQLDPETLFNGIAFMDYDIEKKKFVRTGYLPTYMHYEWTAEEAASEDLLERNNFEMYVIDEAAEPLSRSQLDTTIDKQTARITDTLTRYEDIEIVNSTSY